MNQDDKSNGKTELRGKVELRVFGGGSRKSRKDDEMEKEAEEEPIRLAPEPAALVVKRIEEVEAAPALEEASPQGMSRDRRVSYLLGATGVLLALGGVVLAIAMRERVEAPVEPAVVDVVPQLQLKSELKVDGLAEFEAMCGEAGVWAERALELLYRYSEAESADEVIGLLRAADRDADFLAKHWKPLGEVSRNVGVFTSSFALHNGRSCVVISGETLATVPFSAMMVLEDGELRYDWRASEGIGDVSFEELVELGPGEEVEMRVVMRPSNFYTSVFPEGDYRSCLLADATGMDLVWGYLPVGSAVDDEVKRIFNEGSHLFATDHRPLKVTLVLEKKEDSQARQFVIKRVAQLGWVAK